MFRVSVLAFSAVTLLAVGGSGGAAQPLAPAPSTTLRIMSGPTGLPKPPPGRATIGGKWTELGSPASGEEVELERKLRARPWKTVAKTQTGPRGNFVFKGVLPGTYRLSIGLVVESAKIEGKSCRLPGFVTGLSIGGTDKSGTEVTLMTATSKVFKAKAGDRLTKNIRFSCS